MELLARQALEELVAQVVQQVQEVTEVQAAPVEREALEVVEVVEVGRPEIKLVVAAVEMETQTLSGMQDGQVVVMVVTELVLEELVVRVKAQKEAAALVERREEVAQ